MEEDQSYVKSICQLLWIIMALSNANENYKFPGVADSSK